MRNRTEMTSMVCPASQVICLCIHRANLRKKMAKVASRNYPLGSKKKRKEIDFEKEKR